MSQRSGYRLKMRRWYRLVALLMVFSVPATTLAAGMCFGVGDRYRWHLEGNDYKTTPQLLSWLGFPRNNRLLGIWLSGGWNPAWLDGLQSAMDAGYTPVLFDYSLGDIYQEGQGAWRYVQAHEGRFFAGVRRLAHTLHAMHGVVLVVLQPEFNVPGIQNKPAFGRMLAKAADMLHRADHPGLHILVGTCVGDFGHYGAKVYDQREWARFAPALSPALPSLDFLAFQEMRAGTHQNGKGEMKSYTPAQQGIAVLGKRAYAFSAYLKAKYRKPLLLAYFVVATMTPPGEPPGTWEKVAASGYAGLFKQIPGLARNGVFGVMAMSLFDDMAHNNDGRDFWGNASDYFGLVKANAPLGQNYIGYPPYVVKPAGKVWLAETRKQAKAPCRLGLPLSHQG